MFIYFIPGVTPGLLFEEPWTAYINACRSLGSVKVTTDLSNSNDHKTLLAIIAKYGRPVKQ